MDASITTQPTLEDLNRKIDFLTEQLAFVSAELRHQQESRMEWDELKNDATPIVNDLFRITVNQLEEVESYVQFEDILHLFKRLLRNTRNFEQMLDQLESGIELWEELNPLTQNAFFSLMNRLDALEQKGYFAFFEAIMKVADNVVVSFSDADIDQLNDNIPLIVDTMREISKPETFALMKNAVQALHTDDGTANPSLFSILRQLNDPAVKRGLLRSINVLKTVTNN